MPKEPFLHHKHYGKVDNANCFVGQSGPYMVPVHVHANVHESLNYPEHRISLTTGWPSDTEAITIGFTVEKAMEIIRHLQAAVDDVIAHVPSMAPAQATTIHAASAPDLSRVDFVSATKPKDYK